MKTKYLLRGLGLGMIITAVVMGAYAKSAVAKARVDILKEYGIGEEAALKETLVDVEKETVESSPAETQTQQEAPQQTDTPYDKARESEIDSILDAAKAEQEGIQSTVSDEEAESVNILPEQVSEVQEASQEQDKTITIEISKGDDSGSVSRKLKNAGLVENAAEFDAFLMQHGYDKKLNTGTKTISIADSWQDIAEKLIRK